MLGKERERGEAVSERQGELESLRRGEGERWRQEDTHTQTHTHSLVVRWTEWPTALAPLVCPHSLPQRPSLPTQPPAGLHTSTCHWGSLTNPASPLRSGSSFFRHFPKRGEAETRPCEAGARGSAPPLALGAACSVWPQRQIAPEDGAGDSGENTFSSRGLPQRGLVRVGYRPGARNWECTAELGKGRAGVFRRERRPCAPEKSPTQSSNLPSS